MGVNVVLHLKHLLIFPDKFKYNMFLILNDIYDPWIIICSFATVYEA